VSNRTFETRAGSHWRFHENTPQAVRDPASISPMRFLYLPIAVFVFIIMMLLLSPILLLTGRSRR
jgi:hypothetical protein